MALSLRTVAPSQGARWVADGLRLFAKQPMQFSLLFVVFLAAMVISSLFPVVGTLAMLSAMPLMSLGFMVASESALRGGPVHPGQFVSPLAGDAGRRRSLLVLCALYGAATLAILLVSEAIDDGSFERLQRLLADGNKTAELRELANDPSLMAGLIARGVGATLLSIPFWHAPALVHWGGQKPAHALFSSTLAVWRCKGAFLVYALAWFGVVAVFGAVVALLLGLLGLERLIGLVALPAGLIFSTAFYVSLLFTFNDSFGSAGPAAAP